MKTITPVLWSRLTKNNEKRIFIRVTENRKSTYQSLGISINPKLWLPHSGRVSKTHPDYEEINEKIENEIKKIRSKDIKRKKSKSYLEYHKNYQNDLIEANKFGSYKKFNTVYQHLKDFKTTLGKADITFEDIDKAFLTKLRAYFTKKKIGGGSQRTYFKQIRLLLTEAIKEELHEPSLPLEVIFPTISISSPGPKSLSKAELTKIIRHKGLLEIDHEELHKNINLFHTINFFLFSFFAYGMRFGDLARLKWGNIQGDLNNQRIYYTMTKTQAEHNLKLFDQLVELLRFYLPTKLKLVYLSHVKDVYLFNSLTKDEREMLLSGKLKGNQKLGDNTVFISQQPQNKSGSKVKPDIKAFIKKRENKIDIDALRKFISVQALNNPEKYIFPILQKSEEEISPAQFYKHVESRLSIYNNNLGEVKKECKLNKRLTSHVARHSFSFISLKEGANLYELSVSLNHQELSTTQSYLKRDRSFIDSPIGEIYNKMFEPEKKE